MNIIETTLNGLKVIEPKYYPDDRGYFFESYSKQKFIQNNIPYNFIQDNQSFSKKGVIRGLHLQIAPFEQTKLVRVLDGEIFDIAVDLRKSSPTYSQYFGIRLSSENKKQLLIPKGFAHGFSVLSNTATVMYKVDEVYNKSCERGIIFNDTTLNIDWQINENDIVVSEKDLLLPQFEEFKLNQ